MRTWLIIVSSAAAATAAVGLLLLAVGPPPYDALAAWLLVRIPLLAVLWIAVYGIAVLVSVIVIDAVASDVPAGSERTRRYVERLTTAQFLTATVLLAAFALLPFRVDATQLPVLPRVLVSHPASGAAAVLAVGGLLGWLALAAAARSGRTVRSRLPAESPELRLLQELILLLRVRNAAATPPEADTAPGADRYEQEHRAVLAAVKDLATAVNRLSRDLRHDLEEIKAALREPRADAAAAGSLAMAEDAAGELRAAAAALDASLARFREIAEAPAVATVPLQAPDESGAAARSHLSSELQALLRDMTAGAA